MIVTELRTKGFNLAFRFENIDFLRNVLRVYDLCTWFRCFLTEFPVEDFRQFFYVLHAFLMSEIL